MTTGPTTGPGTGPTTGPTTRQATMPLPGPLPPPVIELRRVGFAYPGQRHPDQNRGDADRSRRITPPWRHPARHRRDGTPVATLGAVDLVVRAGELVMLTGQPRSGRSTLLNVIGLLLRPTTGRYLLNGLDTARLGDRDLAALRGRRIGRVFQPPQLLAARSALDNVMLPLLYTGPPGARRRSAAIAALGRVGLAARAHVRASELSAGERQLVAIARALVTEPSLLLCDDPTASLDPAMAAQITGLLIQLHRDGLTVLAASGDQLAAACGSRCVSIDAGRPATEASSVP